MAKLINYGKAYSKVVDLYCLLSKNIKRNGVFPPLQALFELTYRCNFRCSMCQFTELFKDERLKDSIDKEIKPSEIENVLSQLPSRVVVTLTGGEPFIRKDIHEIIDICTRKNRCHIITNGFALNEDKIKRIIPHSCRSLVSKGLLFIDFSIQGPEEIHDRVSGVKNSFGTVVDNIKILQREKKKLKRRYPLVNIKTVITEDTVSGLHEIYKVAVDLKADVCSFLVCSSIESNFSRLDFIKDNSGIEKIISNPAKHSQIDIDILKTELEKIREDEKKSEIQVRFSPQSVTYDEIVSYHEGKIDITKYRCGSPWTKLYVSAYGDIMSCFNRTVGNIREDKIDDAWVHPILKNLRDRLDKQNGIFPACIGCCQSEFRG